MRDILQLIFDLSQISNLKFVGGTSLFLQGYTSSINDIDVLVQDLDEISRDFEVIIIEESVYKFPNRHRAYFIRNEIMVDIFVQTNIEETVFIDGYAVCSSISAEIEFLNKILTLNLSRKKRQEVSVLINQLNTM